MEHQKSDLLNIAPFENVECDCEKCQSMCKAPCCGNPQDIKILIEKGYADRLMLDDWPDGPNLLKPAMKGSEGKRAPWAVSTERGCTFWKDGKCELHDSGLKPIQGKMALHGRSDEECEVIGEYIRKVWEQDECFDLIESWKKQVNYKDKGFYE